MTANINTNPNPRQIFSGSKMENIPLRLHNKTACFADILICGRDFQPLQRSALSDCFVVASDSCKIMSYLVITVLGPK